MGRSPYLGLGRFIAMISSAKMLRLGIVLILVIIVASGAHCQRVLVVTSDQYAVPSVMQSVSGTYVCADLVAAGLPFDIRAYSRFMTMDMSPYDVIILNGYTSPIPVSQVSDRCAALMAAGKKIFIKGWHPFRCYDSAGTTYTELYYGDRLFGANRGTNTIVSGATVIPKEIEKDPAITALGIAPGWVQTYTLPTPAPPLQILIAGNKLVGFVGPTGGEIRGSADYEYSLIDYGKLVNYIRHGSGAVVGFANDRYKGQPIVAFHTDCHEPSVTRAIQALSDIASRYGIPLTNTLVYNGITPSGASAWNTTLANNPLMAVGSHSRTHPQDWPSITDLASETSLAIADTRSIIPKTLNFLSFSGNKDPNAAELDWLYQNGVLFDGQGVGQRRVWRLDGTMWEYQALPINNGGMNSLAQCQYCPTWPSETLYDDSTVYNSGNDYAQVIATQYETNIKYGMYSYGYFHDTFADPQCWRTVNGIQMNVYIDNAMKYLHDHGAYFMFPHELIPRLQDYIAGNVSYVTNPDGTATITATRPNKLINEIKVGFKGDMTPSALPGPSVVAQRLAGECLYIELPAETTSTVQVQWTWTGPVTPRVSYDGIYVTTASSVSWSESMRASEIAEYQYAVGTVPGGTTALNWTSAGTATSAVLTGAQLVTGHRYFISVRARYNSGGWSPPGSSGQLTADTTPPKTPTVTDDGTVQASLFKFHATWKSQDNDSGVVKYMCAIGTQPGAWDTVGWANTTGREIILENLNMMSGSTYYCSVKACNGAGLWSDVGSSDGIQIEPTVGSVRGLAEGDVGFKDAVVTRVFTGEYYVESLDRSGGIKVVGGDPVQEGQVLVISGTLQRGAMEPYITNPIITVTGTAPVKPIFIPCRALAGGTDGRIQGAGNGAGVNNVGLLVRVVGKVIAKDTGCIFVDDGANVLDWPAGPRGVLVRVADNTAFRVGSFVSVIGIATLEVPNGIQTFKRTVRIQSDSDVSVLIP